MSRWITRAAVVGAAVAAGIAFGATSASATNDGPKSPNPPTRQNFCAHPESWQEGGNFPGVSNDGTAGSWHLIAVTPLSGGVTHFDTDFTSTGGQVTEGPAFTCP